MRTLLMAPELFTDNGGIPRILRLYLKAICDLAGKNNKVRFISLNDHTADSRDLRRYSTPALEAWQTCNENKALYISSTLRLSRQCNHIICGHVAQLPVALAARCLNPRLTYDVIAHGIEVWRAFSLAERMALRFSRNILCISRFTRDHMRNFCNIPVARMPIVPNGLDAFFPISSSVQPPSNPHTIATVARLSRHDIYKGIDTLIEALPLIRKQIPDANLCIMGKGDDSGRLREISNRLNLGAAVQMPGFVSDEVLQEKLSQCGLFALPSKKEGFGLVFLEAMAQGRPCLGARAGGIPEVITPDVGLLIEYGNIPQIAASCIEALSKQWNHETILRHAQSFSYPIFRDRLGRVLSND